MQECVGEELGITDEVSGVHRRGEDGHHGIEDPADVELRDVISD
jgi:hypothetical protein